MNAAGIPRGNEGQASDQTGRPSRRSSPLARGAASWNRRQPREMAAAGGTPNGPWRGTPAACLFGRRLAVLPTAWAMETGPPLFPPADPSRLLCSSDSTHGRRVSRETRHRQGAAQEGDVSGNAVVCDKGTATRDSSARCRTALRHMASLPNSQAATASCMQIADDGPCAAEPYPFPSAHTAACVRLSTFILSSTAFIWTLIVASVMPQVRAIILFGVPWLAQRGFLPGVLKDRRNFSPKVRSKGSTVATSLGIGARGAKPKTLHRSCFAVFRTNILRS